MFFQTSLTSFSVIKKKSVCSSLASEDLHTVYHSYHMEHFYNTLWWFYNLPFLQLSLSTCITVQLNSGIPLTCLPDDAPVLADPTYTWSFTSAHTQQQHTLEEKGEVLNLRNINTTQEGQYKCVQDGFKAEDRMRLSRTFTIRVEG